MTKYQTTLRLTKWLSVLILAVSLLSACPSNTKTNTGGGSPAAEESVEGESPKTEGQAGGASDACKLVTKAEVGAAVGKTVLDGESDANETGKSCTFTDNASAPTFLVILAVSATPQSKEEFEASVKEHETEVEGTAEPVSGLGDEAFWIASSKQPELVILKGQTVLTVAGVAKDAAIEIGKKVVGRL